MGSRRLLLRVLLLPVLLVVLLESAFFFAGVGQQEYLRFDPVVGFAPIGKKRVTWRKEGYSDVQLNSLGMNDVERTFEKPENTYRIAVLGDSYVEALQVARDSNFCSLIEATLNEQFPSRHFEVLNLGVSSYSLGQQMLRLQNPGIKFQPDLVLLVVRNDATYLLPPDTAAGFFGARPSFFLDAHRKLIADYTAQEFIVRSMEGKRILLTSWLRENSRIWGVLSKCVEHSCGWFRKVTAADFSGAAISKKRTAFGESETFPKTYAANQIAGRATLPHSTDNCVRFMWPIAHAIIEEMQSVCHRNGSEFCVIRLGGVRGYQNEIETDRLSNTANQLKIPYFDTTPALNKLWRQGQSSKIWYQSHFTPLGHKVLAEEITPFVTKLIKK